MVVLITRRARNLLADELAGWFLNHIRAEFEDAGFEEKTDPNAHGGARRLLVAGYLYGMDFSRPEDAAAFARVASAIATISERRALEEHQPRRIAGSDPLRLPKHPMAEFIAEMEERCGYEWRDHAFRARSASARLADTKAFAERLDLAHLGEHIRRIEDAIESDPRQAIGSAKELVETVAKTVLRNRGVTFDRSADLPALGKLVFKALKQVPDDIPNAAKGADVIRRVLSNLATVVQGVAELRGFYGTGHGQDGRTKGLGPRHAHLAVGAAATLAFYWLETDRENPTAVPSASTE